MKQKQGFVGDDICTNGGEQLTFRAKTETNNIQKVDDEVSVR
jgi:hypothetical protein